MKSPAHVLGGVMLLVVSLSPLLSGQVGPPPPGAPPGVGGRSAAQTPRQMAPVDLTGTWVSVITEEWTYRMLTPRKGTDFIGIPMNAAARKIAMAWDPAADKAAGLQCKGYGAPGLMRLPGRARISWQDDSTLKLDYDTGEQTRLFHFGGRPPAGIQPSWQGYSVAEWEMIAPPLPFGPGGLGADSGGPPPGGGPPDPPPGLFAGPRPSRSLKVVTTGLRPGYLRKNGVPYGEKTVLAEYLDQRTEPNGDNWFTVVTIVEDPDNLGGTYIMSSDFKKEADGSKWTPTPCSAR